MNIRSRTFEKAAEMLLDTCGDGIAGLKAAVRNI